jgi:ABC-type antimicrobial peptide transport system permease subunit
VRRALGARAGDLIALVARQAARVAGQGLALGIAGALALAHVLRALLFAVQPVDPVTLAAVVAVVVAATVVATLGPLSRALAVDPARALRGD